MSCIVLYVRGTHLARSEFPVWGRQDCLQQCNVMQQWRESDDLPTDAAGSSQYCKLPLSSWAISLLVSAIKSAKERSGLERGLLLLSSDSPCPLMALALLVGRYRGSAVLTRLLS